MEHEAFYATVAQVIPVLLLANVIEFKTFGARVTAVAPTWFWAFFRIFRGFRVALMAGSLAVGEGIAMVALSTDDDKGWYRIVLVGAVSIQIGDMVGSVGSRGLIGPAPSKPSQSTDDSTS